MQGRPQKYKTGREGKVRTAHNIFSNPTPLSGAFRRKTIQLRQIFYKAIDRRKSLAHTVVRITVRACCVPRTRIYTYNNNGNNNNS